MTKSFWCADAAFSSKSIEHDTPAAMVRRLSALFPWDIDVCASRPNVCARYYSREQDGLAQEWRGLCWMNPPYGRGIHAWLHKAACSTGVPDTAVVCLLPARTDTAWWQDYVIYASQIVFVRGRLKFGQATSSAPFPSALWVLGNLLGPYAALQRALLDGYGWSVRQRARKYDRHGYQHNMNLTGGI